MAEYFDIWMKTVASASGMRVTSVISVIGFRVPAADRRSKSFLEALKVMTTTFQGCPGEDQAIRFCDHVAILLSSHQHTQCLPKKVSRTAPRPRHPPKQSLKHQVKMSPLPTTLQRRPSPRPKAHPRSAKLNHPQNPTKPPVALRAAHQRQISIP